MMMDLLPKIETPAEKPVETPAAEKPAEKQAEAPAEKVVENKEVKGEEKPAEKQEPKKEWYETTKTEKAEKIAEEDKTDYKSEYSSLMSDPLLKAIAEGKKAGKNVAEIIKELQPVDYKSMSLEQLADAYGKSKGWSEDDISDEISKLEGKTRTEIESITGTWLNKLESDQGSKMEKFASTQKETIEKQKESEKHIQQTFEKDLKAECELMLANEINGVKLTKDHVNDFIKTAVEFAPFGEDGTYKMEDVRYYWMGRNIKQFMGAAKAEGASEGREEVLKDINRPNLESSQPQRLPEVKKPLTNDQTAEELLKARMGGR